MAKTVKIKNEPVVEDQIVDTPTERDIRLEIAARTNKLKELLKTLRLEHEYAKLVYETAMYNLQYNKMMNDLKPKKVENEVSNQDKQG